MKPALPIFRRLREDVTPVLDNGVCFLAATHTGFISADPCYLMPHRTCMELHRAAERELGNRQARLLGGHVWFRNILFFYRETGGDGFFYGLPIDSGSVVCCDLRALATSFGRPELQTLL